MIERTPREYDSEERALITRYRDQRATCRPSGCTGAGPDCWVEHGAPAYTTLGGGTCVGCKQSPAPLRKGFVHDPA